MHLVTGVCVCVCAHINFALSHNEPSVCMCVCAGMDCALSHTELDLCVCVCMCWYRICIVSE